MARPQKFDDAQVLDRAMETFWLQGWSVTSIRDLEAALDLKAPSIYRRFGSKDDLERAALERYVDRVIEGRIARYLGVGDGGLDEGECDGDPLSDVWAFVVSALDPGPAGEPLRGCLLTVAALDLPHHPELRSVLADGLARIEAALRRAVERAARAGRLADGVDPAAASANLALAFQGLMVLARSGRPPDELRSMAATLLDGIAGPPGPGHRRPWDDHRR